MSWNAYLDTLVGYGQGKHVDKCAIIGGNGGGLWTDASSPHHIAITQGEATAIANAFSNKDFTPFQAGGCYIAGAKYKYLRDQEGGDDSWALLLKQKDIGSVVVQSSKTAIVIGHCPEDGQQGMCSTAVGQIVDYLISVGC